MREGHADRTGAAVDSTLTGRIRSHHIELWDARAEIYANVATRKDGSICPKGKEKDGRACMP